MKKIIPFILIVAFLFPFTGHAASTPATQTTTTQTVAVDPLDLTGPTLQGKTLATKKKLVESGLRDILAQLTDLSAQTQTTINQLNANGIVTDTAQTAVIDANTSLTKAKNDIDTFKNTPVSLTALKYAANTAEKTIAEAKAHLIDSLTALKASLPSLTTGL